MPRPGQVEVMSIINRDENEGRLLHNGAYDLDSIEEFLEVEADMHVNEANAEKIRTFIAKHPAWRYANPYEGFTLFFFSAEPKQGQMEECNMLHRGATMRLKNCPANALVICDLD